jgi:hypothetical protein
MSQTSGAPVCGGQSITATGQYTLSMPCARTQQRLASVLHLFAWSVALSTVEFSRTQSCGTLRATFAFVSVSRCIETFMMLREQ